MHSSKEQASPVHGRIPALDGVRGLAAAMVFLQHYGGGAQSPHLAVRLIGTATHFGWAGVSLFFALSGFLISGILWDGYDRPGWWRRFFLRRSLRIFPLYYLTLAIALAVLLIAHRAMGEIQGLWIYALYLSDIPLFAAPMAVLDQTVSLAHFWSLAVEEQFYLVWPFVLALLVGRRQNAKRTILTLWALSFVFRLGMLALHAPIEWQTEFLLGRAGELLTGAYVAMLVRGSVDERQRLFRRSPWLLGGGLLALGAICVAQGDPVLQTPLMATVGLALCGICGASVVGACLKPGPKPSLLQSFFLLPPLRWLGKVSYGIYVYNLLLRIPLIALSYTIAPNLDEHTGRPALVGMMAVVSVLGVSALSFYTYERFFLGLKERFTQETAA